MNTTGFGRLAVGLVIYMTFGSTNNILSDPEAYAASIGATAPKADHGVLPVTASGFRCSNEAATMCEHLVND